MQLLRWQEIGAECRVTLVKHDAHKRVLAHTDTTCYLGSLCERYTVGLVQDSPASGVPVALQARRVCSLAKVEVTTTCRYLGFLEQSRLMNFWNDFGW